MRDREVQDRAQRLEWSLRLIDQGWAANRLPAPIIDLSSSPIGALMEHAGYATRGLEELRSPRGFRGSLPEVEQRIKTLTRQRTEAQAALDALLRTDEEKAQQEAESRELSAAFNAMHCKYIDGGYVAYDDDDAVLDVSKMTPIQKRAIERMDAIEREYRQGVVERQSGRG